MEGSWLRIRATELQGWALATNVVPVVEAVALFSGQFVANPVDIHARTMRAIVRQDKQEIDTALIGYTKIIRINSTQAWLFNDHGCVWNAVSERSPADSLDGK